MKKLLPADIYVDYEEVTDQYYATFDGYDGSPDAYDPRGIGDSKKEAIMNLLDNIESLECHMTDLLMKIREHRYKIAKDNNIQH